jgi:hypothetical protein
LLLLSKVPQCSQQRHGLQEQQLLGVCPLLPSLAPCPRSSKSTCVNTSTMLYQLLLLLLLLHNSQYLCLSVVT